jgi:hypothetical protein
MVLNQSNRARISRIMVLALLAHTATGWLNRIATNRDDYANAVAVDSQRNVVAVGVFGGKSLCNTNNLDATASTKDAFVTKYHGVTGARMWIVGYGTSVQDAANAVAVDALDNVYVAGATQAGPFAGSWDATIAKFSPLGEKLWVRSFGTAGAEQATGVAVHSFLLADGAHAVHIFVGGRTDGLFRRPADPGRGASGGQDGFLAKYDGDGAALWAHTAVQFGGGPNASVSDCAGVALAAGPAAGVVNVYVAGTTNGGTDAGGGACEFGGTAAGHGYLLQLAGADGAQRWRRQFGSAGAGAGEAVKALAADAATGDVFVVGSTAGSLCDARTGRAAEGEAAAAGGGTGEGAGEGEGAWRGMLVAFSRDGAPRFQRLFGADSGSGSAGRGQPSHSHELARAVVLAPADGSSAGAAVVVGGVAGRVAGRRESARGVYADTFAYRWLSLSVIV